MKKDEKVDYAIVNDGKPVILVECKKGRISFDKHGSQLFRYYTATDARFAILTNGVEYQFFTDLRKPNVMDKSPFLIVDMLDLKEWQIDEICKFAKPSFDGNAIWKISSFERNKTEGYAYYHRQYRPRIRVALLGFCQAFGERGSG